MLRGVTMRHIETGWNSYRKMVVPSEASDVQVRETRQAFFAGAAILFESLMIMLEPSDEPTDTDMQRMEDIQSEIDEFGLALDLKFFKTVEH